MFRRPQLVIIIYVLQNTLIYQFVHRLVMKSSLFLFDHLCVFCIGVLPLSDEGQ